MCKLESALNTNHTPQQTCTQHIPLCCACTCGHWHTIYHTPTIMTSYIYHTPTIMTYTTHLPYIYHPPTIHIPHTYHNPIKHLQSCSPPKPSHQCHLHSSLYCHPSRPHPPVWHQLCTGTDNCGDQHSQSPGRRGRRRNYTTYVALCNS